MPLGAVCWRLLLLCVVCRLQLCVDGWLLMYLLLIIAAVNCVLFGVCRVSSAVCGLLFVVGYCLLMMLCVAVVLYLLCVKCCLLCVGAVRCCCSLVLLVLSVISCCCLYFVVCCSWCVN